MGRTETLKPWPAWFVMLVILFSIVLLGGCGSPAIDITPTQLEEVIELDQEAELYRIALVMKTLTNPFFIEMEKGARRAEAELGIELIVRTAAQETSIEQQINIVEGLIREQVDAIVIAPGDSVSLIPVLVKAQEAGIVIINIDNRLDVEASEEIGLVGVPFISVDNQLGGYLSAKYIADLVDTPTEAVILEGIATAQNSIDRKAGAVQAFEENPNSELVASVSANWKIDEAYGVAANLFEEHPDVGLVFCANDMMALGVVQFLTDTGRDAVYVAGFDALDEASQAISDGTLMVTIDQQAAEQGYYGVVYAVRALDGEELPPETMIDVLVVIKETLP